MTRSKYTGLYELQREIMVDFSWRRLACKYPLWGRTSEKRLKYLNERIMLCCYVAKELNVCRCCDLGKREKVKFRMIARETMDNIESICLDVHRLFTISFKEEC